MIDLELERFKSDISLVELACAYGYAVDKEKSSKASVTMHHESGDKIVIATDTDGHSIFFSLRDEKQHGSVVDFVQYQERVNLGHVRKILRSWLASPHSTQIKVVRPEHTTHDSTTISQVWSSMRFYRGGYLEKRGLHPETIHKFSERIRLDSRGNVCFRHDDMNGVVGWELKNHHFTGFAEGGRKALFGCKVGSKEEASGFLAIAESAIDIMSYYQLHPHPGFYLSFAGGLSDQQCNLLKYVFNRYPDARIVVATDNDPQGGKYADSICSIRPDASRVLPTVGKDWNDTLLNRKELSHGFEKRR